MKRIGVDDSATNAMRQPDIAGMAFSMRAAEDAKSADAKPKADDEKMSLFWRVFGGTILSVCTLVAITLFNNTMNNLAELRSSVDRSNEARATAVADLRAELAKAAEIRATAINDLRAELAKAAEIRATAINEIRAELVKGAEARAELVRKDEMQTRLTSIYDRIQALQTQNTTQNAGLTSLKTEFDGLKERAGKVGTDLDVAKKDFATSLDALRREQAQTTDALKKDVAVMEGLKERLASVYADNKVLRDELSKLQKDAERNSAYDLERKAQRDVQQKQNDEAIRTLQSAIQDCREKLARMEGQAVKPAGGSKAPEPIENEQ